MTRTWEPNGTTRPYAVLGHPVAHSLSPRMHNASFRALGLDAVYLAFDVAPDRLDAVLPAMRDMGFGGVNLTVPLKETAFRLIPDLADSARRLGAVNTVEFLPDGTLRGHNTDGDGFLLAVRESFGCGVEERTLFVLGCGGAGRAVALTCAAAGAKALILADTDADRAHRLVEEIRASFPAVRAEIAPDAVPERLAAYRRSDAIIQATPVGMKPTDPPVIPAEAFAPDQWAFDLVYMYPETAFMRVAADAGARAANGLGMLLHQGARAFEIWAGRRADTASMRLALEQSVYG